MKAHVELSFLAPCEELTSFLVVSYVITQNNQLRFRSTIAARKPLGNSEPWEGHGGHQGNSPHLFPLNKPSEFTFYLTLLYFSLLFLIILSMILNLKDMHF